MRPAMAGDQPAIRRMIRRAGINPLGLAWRRFVVVEASEGIIACGQVKDHADGSRELASLAVAEGWRGRGLARVIIEHLQRQSGPPLWLTCREGLVPLYTRFGFRKVTEAGDLSPYFRRLMRLAATESCVSGRWISRAMPTEPTAVASSAMPIQTNQVSPDIGLTCATSVRSQ